MIKNDFLLFCNKIIKQDANICENSYPLEV